MKTTDKQMNLNQLKIKEKKVHGHVIEPSFNWNIYRSSNKDVELATKGKPRKLKNNPDKGERCS